jgi:hypothetical protein
MYNTCSICGAGGERCGMSFCQTIGEAEPTLCENCYKSKKSGDSTTLRVFVIQRTKEELGRTTAWAIDSSDLFLRVSYNLRESCNHEWQLCQKDFWASGFGTKKEALDWATACLKSSLWLGEDLEIVNSLFLNKGLDVRAALERLLRAIETGDHVSVAEAVADAEESLKDSE